MRDILQTAADEILETEQFQPNKSTLEVQGVFKKYKIIHNGLQLNNIYFFLLKKYDLKHLIFSWYPDRQLLKLLRVVFTVD